MMSEGDFAARDEVVSELDLREAFVIGSNIRKAGSRRKRVLAKLPKFQGTVTQSAAMFGLVIENP
jgi:hypothetical protein